MAAVSSTSALAAAGTTIIIIPAMACGCSTITATAIRCVIATSTIGAGAAPGGNIIEGARTGDRKRGGKGKSGSIRVDLGGLRIIKKTSKTKTKKLAWQFINQKLTK